MTLKHNTRILFFLTLLTILLTGCSVQKSISPSEDFIVSTSITPLADLIRQVGGDKVQVISLVPAGTDPHDYEPKPEDVRKIALSRIFFANGLGQEKYLEKLLLTAENRQLKTVVLSDGLTILGKDQNSPGNPHLWLDVTNAQAYVIKIRDALSETFPAYKNYFAKNAENYLAQLSELDTWIKEQIETIPPEDRNIIVFHDAWVYYAQRYGLNVLRPLVYNSEAEPSAKDYAEILNLIKKNNVRAVFSEAGFNPKLTQQLAKDTGIKFVENLYVDTLGSTPDSDSYVKMMKTNTIKFVSSLR